MKRTAIISIPSDTGCYEEIGWLVIDTDNNQILSSVVDSYEEARGVLQHLDEVA